MAYKRHNWVNGEEITEAKLNNIEDGIGEAMGESALANNIAEIEKASAAQQSKIVEKADEVISTIPNDYQELSSDVIQQKQDLNELDSQLSETEKFKNLFDYRTITINSCFANDALISSNGYYVSDFIEVKPLTWYSIPCTASFLGSFFDENREYVARAKRSDQSQPSSGYSVIKTTASTKYIRVNGYNGGGTPSVNVSPTKYMVVEGKTYPSVYKRFNDNTLADMYKSSNYLYGKTLLTYGDSITEGVTASTDDETGYKKTYAGLVAKRNGMNFINLGWAGSTMANDGLKPFVYNGQIYSRFDNKLITPDYITVWFGWNDYAHSSIELGAINSMDETTYYGAYIRACKLLIQKFPKARIGLVVPYGMDAEWRDAVRVVARKFGLPYLDLYNNCPCIFDDEDGINSDIASMRKSTFLADGTHPNDEGYEFLSTAYEDFLRRI